MIIDRFFVTLWQESSNNYQIASIRWEVGVEEIASTIFFREIGKSKGVTTDGITVYHIDSKSIPIRFETKYLK